MTALGSWPHTRKTLRSAAVIAVFCCMGSVRPHCAQAQRIANQFGDAAANATQGPLTAGQSGPGGGATTSLVPHIPKTISRPEGWPGGKSGGEKSIDNHVLSSIRAYPGSPLQPLPTASGDGKSTLPKSVSTGPPKGTAKAEPSGVVLANFEEPATAAPLPIPGAQSLETAMIVARVGPEVVLESDLLTPSALEWLAKVSPGLKPEQIRELKMQIYKQVLVPHIESMIVYVDACRTIPEDRLPEIEKKVGEAFDQQQLPRLIKAAGVANVKEYEHLLRSRGQSLDHIRKTFFERSLAQQWVQQKVTSDDEIPHAEMIAWYENHLAEYDFSARVRFEQISIRITPQRSRKAAWDLLAEMGNDVLEGKPFAEIARSRSEGLTAAQGGAYEWTNKSSLASKVLDDAVFTLPVGQLSAILEDGTTLHIVRVIERVEAGRTPFIEAQVGIRDSLQQERRKREMDEYLSKLRERTPVWTIFDEAAGGPLQTAARPNAAGLPR